MNRLQSFLLGFSGLLYLLAGGGSGCRPSSAVGESGVEAAVHREKFPGAGTDVFRATSDVSVDVLAVGERIKVHLEGQIVVERRDPVSSSNGPREIEMDVSSLELSGPMLGEKGEDIITIRGGKKFGLPVQGVIRSVEKGRDFPAISAFPMQFEILVPPVLGAKEARILRHDPQSRFMEISSIRSIPPFGEIFVNVNTEPLAFYDIDDREHKTPVILLQPGVVHDVFALEKETRR